MKQPVTDPANDDMKRHRNSKLVALQKLRRSMDRKGSPVTFVNIVAKARWPVPRPTTLYCKEEFS